MKRIKRIKRIKRMVCLLLLACLLLVSCGNGTGTVSGTESNASENESDNESDNESETASGEVSEVTEYIGLSENDLYDKLLGAWVGQMAGVVLGADNEFWFQGVMMSESDVPDFTTLNINNAFWQDDLYVEITYVEQMAKTGYDTGIDILGEAFKNSTYGLDHANKKGRENLRAGIEASLCGSYLYNSHCDDIDWQIDADFVGEIYAGLVNAAAMRAFEIGHITNYGDGVYGGVFVAAMHAEAYIAQSLEEIITAGFDSIPDGTKFKEVINDVKNQYETEKTWEECWQFIEDKWGNDDRCPVGCGSVFNIDAKLNAAYVLMGLLWGEGDFENSMKISMRCGQDSDCNPSTVGGILGNFYGYENIPDKFKAGLDMTETKFSYTSYSLSDTVYACLAITKQVLEANGATLNDGVWSIPQFNEITPVPFEQWPEEPTVTMTLTASGANVKFDISAKSNLGIESFNIDLGDGTVVEANIACYSYAKAGKYTVTCTVVDGAGNSKTVSGDITTTADNRQDVGEVGTVRNLAPFSAITVSDTIPTGGGSKDINVIRDGAKIMGATLQYDTFVGYLSAHEDYIGYLFTDNFVISSVVYTEGIHYNNGGWFADGTLRLEALIDGVWQTVECPPDPDYPVGNTIGAFGASLETYTFTLDNLTCSGIRLIGTAGGEAGFINCTELEVYGVEAD